MWLSANHGANTVGLDPNLLFCRWKKKREREGSPCPWRPCWGSQDQYVQKPCGMRPVRRGVGWDWEKKLAGFIPLCFNSKPWFFPIGEHSGFGFSLGLGRCRFKSIFSHEAGNPYSEVVIAVVKRAFTLELVCLGLQPGWPWGQSSSGSLTYFTQWLWKEDGGVDNYVPLSWALWEEGGIPKCIQAPLQSCFTG